MAVWNYDQVGIQYDEADLTYDEGSPTPPKPPVVSGLVFGPGMDQRRRTAERKRRERRAVDAEVLSRRSVRTARERDVETLLALLMAEED